MEYVWGSYNYMEALNNHNTKKEIRDYDTWQYEVLSIKKLMKRAIIW